MGQATAQAQLRGGVTQVPHWVQGLSAYARAFAVHAYRSMQGMRIAAMAVRALVLWAGHGFFQAQCRLWSRFVRRKRRRLVRLKPLPHVLGPEQELYAAPPFIYRRYFRRLAERRMFRDLEPHLTTLGCVGRRLLAAFFYWARPRLLRACFRGILFWRALNRQKPSVLRPRRAFFVRQWGLRRWARLLRWSGKNLPRPLRYAAKPAPDYVPPVEASVRTWSQVLGHLRARLQVPAALMGLLRSLRPTAGHTSPCKRFSLRAWPRLRRLAPVGVRHLPRVGGAGLARQRATPRCSTILPSAPALLAVLPRLSYVAGYGATRLEWVRGLTTDLRCLGWWHFLGTFMRGGAVAPQWKAQAALLGLPRFSEVFDLGEVEAEAPALRLECAVQQLSDTEAMSGLLLTWTAQQAGGAACLLGLEMELDVGAQYCEPDLWFQAMARGLHQSYRVRYCRLNRKLRKILKNRVRFITHYERLYPARRRFFFLRAVKFLVPVSEASTARERLALLLRDGLSDPASSLLHQVCRVQQQLAVEGLAPEY